MIWQPQETSPEPKSSASATNVSHRLTPSERSETTTVIAGIRDAGGSFYRLLCSLLSSPKVVSTSYRCAMPTDFSFRYCHTCGKHTAHLFVKEQTGIRVFICIANHYKNDAEQTVPLQLVPWEGDQSVPGAD